MNKLKGGIVLFIIFIVAAYSTFFFEEYLRKAIRYLYEYSTKGSISFFIPGKYIHFVSGEFMFTFGLFMVISSFLLYRQTITKRVRNFFLGILLFIISVVVNCYFNAIVELTVCTACNGTKKLHYNDINYDTIFIGALFFTLIPALATEISYWFKKNKKLS